MHNKHGPPVTATWQRVSSKSSDARSTSLEVLRSGNIHLNSRNAGAGLII